MSRHVFSRGKQTDQVNTVVQQPDDNASEDHGSRQGTLLLVTDLLLCVKQQVFFFVAVSMVMSLTITPGTALSTVLQSSPWQIYHHCYVSQKSVTASY